MTKKYVLAIIVFVVFALSTIVFEYGKQFIPIQVKEVFNNEVKNGVKLKQIQKDETKYKINLFYPETKYNNLNEYVMSKINREQKIFLEQVNEIENLLDDKKCSFDITFNQYEYKSYISFAFEAVEYLQAPHPNSYFFTVIYDTNKNKIIEIEDLIKENPEFLKKISNESYKILKDNKNIKEYSTDENLKDGLKPIKSNFENIVFDKDKIIVFINPYQVAPYVAGNFEVKIPYGKIL